MHLLWKRYARSGYAPSLLYVIIAAAFAALGVWAITERDWLVTAIAVAMVAVTLAGSRIMRRLSEATAASRRAFIDAQKDEHHE